MTEGRAEELSAEAGYGGEVPSRGERSWRGYWKWRRNRNWGIVYETQGLLMAACPLYATFSLFPEWKNHTFLSEIKYSTMRGERERGMGVLLKEKTKKKMMMMVSG